MRKAKEASMDQRSGTVTTHVLDTGRGIPAAGMTIEVFRLEGGARRQIGSLVTNDDGRTDQPAIAASDLAEGEYELVFHAGAYLERVHGPATGRRFLDLIPIRFGIGDPGQHYHVPLLLSPFAYSTYRGS
jgi:5-hydroxyisourate hydrolase